MNMTDEAPPAHEVVVGVVVELVRGAMPVSDEPSSTVPEGVAITIERAGDWRSFVVESTKVSGRVVRGCTASVSLAAGVVQKVEPHP